MLISQQEKNLINNLNKNLEKIYNGNKGTKKKDFIKIKA